MSVANVSTVINVNNKYVWQHLQSRWPQWESKLQLWSSWHHSILIQLCTTTSLWSNCKHMSICFIALLVCLQTRCDSPWTTPREEKQGQFCCSRSVAGSVLTFHIQTRSTSFWRPREVGWIDGHWSHEHKQTNTDMHQWAHIRNTGPKPWMMYCPQLWQDD